MNVRFRLAPVAFVLAAACQEVATAPTRPQLTPQAIRRIEVTAYPGRDDGFTRGVYYFPGWHPGDYGRYMGVEAPSPNRWNEVQANNSAHPEVSKQPFWGWYDEASQDIADAQILAMQDAGFDFVVYQIGWSYNEWAHEPIDGVQKDSVYQGHAPRNHMASPYHDHLKFAVSWQDVVSDSAHNTSLTDACSLEYCFWAYKKNVQGWTAEKYRASFAALVRYWFTQYIQPNGVENADYLFFGSARQPVIFIFSPWTFLTANSVFGGATSPADMTALLRSIAAEYGYSGTRVPFLVVPGIDDVSALPAWGFSGFSAYVEYPSAPGYSNVRDAYAWRWQHQIDQINNGGLALKYFVPNLAGLDQRGVGRTNWWVPVPSEVTDLVNRSETFASAHSSQTQNYLMTCCWNEWTEGEILEPGMLFDAGPYKGSALADAHRTAVTGTGDRAPEGWLDEIDANGVAVGWAMDPETPNQPIYVSFFAGASYWSGGTYIGFVKTDRLRSDVNSTYGVEGTHGFSFQIPSAYYGVPIYVAATNSSGYEDLNRDIGGLPRVWSNGQLTSVGISGPTILAPQQSGTWTANTNPSGTYFYTWLVNGIGHPGNHGQTYSYSSGSSFDLTVTVSDGQNSASASQSVSVSACYPYDC